MQSSPIAIDDPNLKDENGSQFYFQLRLRSFVTIPLLILMLANPIYHSVMALLIEVDLFLGNFLVWLFFGELIAAGMGLGAVTISSIPIIFLPDLWRAKRLWGVAKIGIFLIGFFLATLFSGLVSVAALWLLDVFSEPRTTLWWGELWGTIS